MVGNLVASLLAESSQEHAPCAVCVAQEALDLAFALVRGVWLGLPGDRFTPQVGLELIINQLGSTVPVGQFSESFQASVMAGFNDALAQYGLQIAEVYPNG